MASKFSLLRAILLDLSPSFWMASVLVVTQWPLLVILWHHGEKFLLKNGFGMVKWPFQKESSLLFFVMIHQSWIVWLKSITRYHFTNVLVTWGRPSTKYAFYSAWSRTQTCCQLVGSLLGHDVSNCFVSENHTKWVCLFPCPSYFIKLMTYWPWPFMATFVLLNLARKRNVTE